jgi:hypothetical protein
MGYAVDYIPTGQRKPRRSRVQGSKARRTKDIKNAIRWNIDRLDRDTTSTSTVERRLICRTLKFNAITATTDTDGDHVLQQLISEGYVSKPVERRGGQQLFDRDDLLKSLRAYAGM